MKTKQIPLIVMLLAGAVTSISTRLMRYELEASLWILLIVLIVFYIAGCALARTIDSFEAQARRADDENGEISDEGEVIEKEASDDAAQTGAETGNAQV